MNWWEMLAGTAIASVIAYLIGSFSFSITIVKLKTKKDVRDEGSKNAGATNASRIIGKKWGVAIMIFDALKIILASSIALGLSQIPTPIFQGTLLLVPGLFALIGHCWPIYYKFKGGKAVSCFIGLMFTINYLMGLVMFATWLTLVLVTRKVSIGSIFAAIVTAILMWVPQISGLSSFDIDGSGFATIYATGSYSAVWFNKYHTINESGVFDSFLIINLITTISMIILLARHWQNIQRLIKGTEPAFLKERKSKSETKVKTAKTEKTKKENNKNKSTANE
ncbi:glycerol-3-phosphate 1-O-acyltransferase PlsY [Spiroplasma monobiae]|uniref:Glycerol-3-phosphate acyltransferase n=1 Tax=Spiroplasma monobiae MQ-1 TaxID=1336748 RepID=A0A2K9LUC8_SPISQ|nr:glycerol-3-phosphate 1-O-acyltransferase PlsY [Spiroplasma monobiae]AUM62663.1 glycerol-3-phosphate acyltransferase PlsY [Spiroplasma monobiae MQ-1]